MLLYRLPRTLWVNSSPCISFSIHFCCPDLLEDNQHVSVVTSKTRDLFSPRSWGLAVKSEQVLNSLQTKFSLFYSVSDILSYTIDFGVASMKFTRPSWTEIHAFEDPWKITCKTLEGNALFFKEFSKYRWKNVLSSKFLRRYYIFSDVSFQGCIQFHVPGALKFPVWKKPYL